MSDQITEIRKRHESNDLWIEADTDGWQAHQDRGMLLEHIAELKSGYEITASDLEKAETTIAELKAALQIVKTLIQGGE